MFQVSEVLNDPDLCQFVTLTRTFGQFGPGGWEAIQPPKTFTMYGCITIADSKALQQIPEGDRVIGSLQFDTVTPIYTTSEDLSLISDEITWQDKLYRVQAVAKWRDFGYYSAILVRMQGS